MKLKPSEQYMLKKEYKSTISFLNEEIPKLFSSLSHKLFLYEIDFNELKENYDRYIKVNNQILQIFELEINTYNYCIENKFNLQAVFGNIRDFYPFNIEKINFDEINNIKNKEDFINLMLKYKKFFDSIFI
jgi:hypothetical protein